MKEGQWRGFHSKESHMILGILRERWALLLVTISFTETAIHDAYVE